MRDSAPPLFRHAIRRRRQMMFRMMRDDAIRPMPDAAAPYAAPCCYYAARKRDAR